MKVIVTGCAGFIGFFLSRKLCENGFEVLGIDNLNDYYDISLKEYRLEKLRNFDNFKFQKGDIVNKEFVMGSFKKFMPDLVINLAAQAGVRYSIVNPDAYINSNIIGFYNILEACRHSYEFYSGVKHLVFASSSSVYGENSDIPYSINDKTDKPVSLYAATKKSNELLAYAYSKLYNIPTTGLRFFTVYGPAGRPDMAYFGFTNKLLNGEKIKIFNFGKCQRDFTYIDDIVDGIFLVLEKPPFKKEGLDGLPIAPFNIYNIGNNHPENLLDFINILTKELVNNGLLPKDFDINSHIDLIPMQKGDVPITYADIEELERDFNFKPETSLEDGLHYFVLWYKEYYKK